MGDGKKPSISYIFNTHLNGVFGKGGEEGRKVECVGMRDYGGVGCEVADKCRFYFFFNLIVISSLSFYKNRLM